MNDSGVYVGACLRRCDVVLNHMWMENNALGYSGTNSGGTIVIENSQFDGNQDGLDTNTAVVGDPPAPQDGPRERHTAGFLQIGETDGDDEERLEAFAQSDDERLNERLKHG